ncbi:DUF7146 domain-containing protein [Salipiger bermudensis]|uniref:Virulence-associated protein E n=1 Tax=Salipiger bermudensis (strain DSM 26914 / JCM 13377 / KCTC 12554 / HTCC2601) TaxID=314265 RepID=Q0FU06_SALBH|nr:toprim domain-containing protein [Salipiger bermudensis]EAU47593.1 virulence-associated protein E [Salipiger bermudensis HTCC2601]
MTMTAQDLTKALGGRWHRYYGLAFCPAHDNRNTPALSIATGEDGRLLLKCFAGCAYRDIAKALEARDYIDRAHPQVPKTERPAKTSERRGKQARRVWDAATSIHKTLAENYLRRRGIRSDLHGSLRYHHCCWHGPSSQCLPAMIARIDGAADFAIHRTYLAPDGTGKAAVAPTKMMLGAARGGAVRLGPGDAAGPLVVAEGIETALSLPGMLDHVGPVWAALSTSGMVNLLLPRTPGSLIIATDGDAAGHRAGQKLAKRAHALGWRVSILEAPESCDWNDMLIAEGYNQ